MVLERSCGLTCAPWLADMGAWSITINGVSRTLRIEWPSVTVQQILTSQVDTMTFTMRLPEGAYAECPTAGQAITFLDGTDKLFAGIVTTNPRSFVGNTGELMVQVTAQDFQAQLTRKLAAVAYDNRTAGYIAQDLLSQMPGSFGFTIGTVQAGPVLQKWTVNYQNINDALETLAKAVGFDWYIDYDKRLFFYDSSAAMGNAPWDLTEGAAAPYLSSAPYSDLQYQEDVTQVRNVVTVRGARTQSVLSTQREVGNGQSRNFVMNLGEVIRSSLTMNIGGVGQSVGEEGIIDPSLVSWLVNYKNRSIQATAGTPTPTSGAIIEFIYRYETQIIVTARNEPSIAIFGEWDHVIVNPEITDRTIAIQVAQADLRAFGTPAITASYTTSRPGLRSGLVQVLNIPRFGINARFVIRAVTMRPRAYTPGATLHQAAGYFKQYAVELERV